MIKHTDIYTCENNIVDWYINHDSVHLHSTHKKLASVNKFLISAVVL